ncbi:MAG: DUF4055 domain-containing protein [Planctomycetes bacterium]|nr:DUF4055 domain-containing protein [Planctomycetota bacterium]
MNKNLSHPLHTAMVDIWNMAGHSYTGESAIKAHAISEGYLPFTHGQVLDGARLGQTQKGYLDYVTFLTRAVYPSLYEEAVDTAIGIMHKKPAVVALPKAMESLLDNATGQGESLTDVLRMINTRQLIDGRLGILGDFRNDEGVVIPKVSLYNALQFMNWSTTPVESGEEEDDLETENSEYVFLVLDESGMKLSADFKWVDNPQYRVITLSQGEAEPAPDTTGDTYITAILDDEQEVLEGDYFTPTYKNTVANTIPFACINTLDIAPDPDLPPLLSLALDCLTIFRGEADYRLNLHMQGQDTLVKIGGSPDDVVRVGTGSVINVPIGGDVKYVGVGSEGLSEQRVCLENDYERAAKKTGKLFESNSRMNESAAAKKIRQSAQTASLPQIAQAGAAGLEKVLKDMAVWMGANPDEVEIVPNLDFTDDAVDGDTLVDIMTAKGLGAPVSMESIHGWLADNNLTKISYEDEMQLIATEKAVSDDFD